MAGELPWMNKILREIKNECNKVRSIQHILSRKKHTSLALQSHQLRKNSEISVNLSDCRKMANQSSAAALKFGCVYTNHMLKMEYVEKYGGWQRPVITPLQEISLHPGAKVLQYAMTLFEGLKAYRGIDEKIRLFRPVLNLNRLNNSAERSCLPTIDEEYLLKCIEHLVSIDQEWVPYSSTGSLYIRPTIIATDPTLGVGMSNSALLYVILSPAGAYFNTGLQSIRLLADPTFIRAWPGGTGDKKMGCNYASTTFIQKKAHDLNCQQVLWLFGEDEQITEAGTMNIFTLYINDNNELELSTPPLNGCILPGITRLSLLELAKEWNEFKVVEKTITMSQLIKLNQEKRLLEFFGAGTACAVCPISEVVYNDEIIKIPTTIHENPVHIRLLNALTDIQYGRRPHPWTHVIDTHLYDQFYDLQVKQQP